MRPDARRGTVAPAETTVLGGELPLPAEIGRPRVCALARMRRGVMFTEPVAGSTLAGLVLARPHDTAGLLKAAYGELAWLHQQHFARSLAPYGVIGERSIEGTFRRKFDGAHGVRYVNELGAQPGGSAGREDLALMLDQVLARLRMLMPLLQSRGRSVLVYGELKPEHVLFPDGLTGRPVFIDPGLLRARAVVDAAKLVSRTVLLLAACRPGEKAGRQASEGLAVFADAQMRALPGAAGAALRGYVGTVLVVTNPVDLMTRLFAESSGCRRVYGIGSNLDTARYHLALARHFDVSPRVVSGHVIGEHGDASVVCASSTTIRGRLVGPSIPVRQVRDELRSRPGRISAGVGRTRSGPAGAVLSALRKTLGLSDGTEELSAPYEGGWLGVPLRFTAGEPTVCLPDLDADEHARFAAADAKLRAAYRALRLP